MNAPHTHPIGDIDQADLTALAVYCGLDYLPYPLNGKPIHRRAKVNDLHDWLHPQQLADFQTWIEHYRTAHVWVTARTFPTDPQLPDRRVIGFRDIDSGYLATQHNATISVERVSTNDLSSAIAAAIALTTPGPHRRIAIPRYRSYFDSLNRQPKPEFDDTHIHGILRTTTTTPSKPGHIVIPDSQLTATTVIQAMRGLPNDWGVDWAKPAAVVIHTRDDSDTTADYLYTADYTYATPIDQETLTNRINSQIADSGFS